MDTRIATDMITLGWWACAGCGVEAELPTSATAGCAVPCPDCAGVMIEQWSWEPTSGRAGRDAAWGSAA